MNLVDAFLYLVQILQTLCHFKDLKGSGAFENLALEIVTNERFSNEASLHFLLVYSKTKSLS